MSCSVKISSGKSWSGSQRRISSLAEENTCPSPNGAASSCALLQTIQTTNNVLVASSLATTYTTTSSTGLETITATTATATTTTTTTTTIGGPAAVAANIAGVFGASGTAAGGVGQRIATPRPVKSIATKKGEDTSKLLNATLPPPPPPPPPPLPPPPPPPFVLSSSSFGHLVCLPFAKPRFCQHRQTTHSTIDII
ncbi:serine-rich adhesin for platelets-like isoform X1, partial [Vespula maculifrons]